MKKLLLLFSMAVLFTSCSEHSSKQNAKQETITASLKEEKRSQSRVKEMEGAKNFRDLGGYTNSEGKSVPWNKLFRSEKLSDLSDRDVQLFEELGIKTVIDLRTDWELEKDPDRIPAGVATLRIPMWREAWNPYKRLMTEELDSLERAAIIEESAKSDMKDTYTAFPEEFKAEAEQFMAILAEEKNYPILFHCTAGTDRTGFMAALTLSLLDVPEEIIIEDYALSKKLRLNETEKDTRIVATLDQLRTYGGAKAYMSAISPDNSSKVKAIRGILLH